ncbi:hypothetical protein VCR20J5_280161 [Vibrio crassostreae]|nr:hypothetical protein VCR20J5_280161 [Vibrio crassostreae]CDT54779.1 hypothetical protein VCR15J5_670196 [Vibrio crassostreae]
MWNPKEQPLSCSFLFERTERLILKSQQFFTYLINDLQCVYLRLPAIQRNTIYLLLQRDV